METGVFERVDGFLKLSSSVFIRFSYDILALLCLVYLPCSLLLLALIRIVAIFIPSYCKISCFAYGYGSFGGLL